MRKALTIISLLFLCSTAFATTHNIAFGGGLGFAYSPNSLTVNVGDTITWTGDFSFHPLISTSIPGGAPALGHSGAAGSYSYVVEVAGTYNFECGNHGVSMNMKGTFTAEDISAGVKTVSNITTKSFFVNDGGVNVLYTGFNKTGYTLTVFDLTGKIICSNNIIAGSKYVLPLSYTGLYIAHVEDAEGEVLTAKVWNP